MSSDYRLAPALAARLVGLLLLVAAILVFAATGAVALLDLHSWVLLAFALAVVAAVLAAAAQLRRTTVVHFGESGYRISLIRGAGVKEAAWTEVEDAVTASPRDIPCVVLRLRDGRSTTIPVQALAADREAFVRDLQQHLQRGHGLRPFRQT